MKKVFFDTNILLDIALERRKYNKDAINLIKLIKNKQIKGFINGAGIVSIHYIISKSRGKTTALQFIKDIIKIFEIAELDKKVIQNAINSNFTDFEDAIQEFSAIDAGVEIIVTRNTKDFKNSRLQVFEPKQLIKYFEKKQN